MRKKCASVVHFEGLLYPWTDGAKELVRTGTLVPKKKGIAPTTSLRAYTVTNFGFVSPFSTSAWVDLARAPRHRTQTLRSRG